MRTDRILCWVLAAAFLIAIPARAEESEPRASLEGGRTIYRIHCSACHGEQGRGDGPTAEVLRIPPPDLTRLESTWGDSFPVEQVTSVIDGRQTRAAHGGSQMPIWGLAFQQPGQDSNQEREVRVRIEALVRYLQSIQR